MRPLKSLRKVIWLFFIGTFSLVLFSPSIDAAQSAFDEQFNGATLDTNAWLPVGPARQNFNNEQQCYVTNANAVTGGNLEITSRLATTACATGVKNYTAGMIQWQTYNFTYGTVHFRLKNPGGQGPWPAVWLLGADCQATNPTDSSGACQWPSSGSNEIDLMETLQGDPTKVYHTVFYATGTFVNCQPIVTDTSQNWHDYSFTWTPSSLTWTIDGVTTCAQTQPELIPSKPMFLMINTAIGGLGGGAINNAIFPQTMQVDYIQVFPSGAGNPAPRISSVSPSTVTVGGSSVTLTVNGANFVPGSVVRISGQDRTTTFVSESQVTVTLSASDLSQTGSRTVLVSNPAPGGGSTALQTLAVVAANASTSNSFFNDAVRNYPNPFRLGGGSTKFVALTNESGSVEIHIYDAGGQLVQTVTRSASGAGRLELFWDGHNSQGEMVSPGLYFARIEGRGVHEETQFRRVVAVK